VEIGFSLKNDVQVISISGTIGEQEAAAIRFKLDEKINMGRQKICFDLSAFQFNDKTCADYLKEIALFAINREVQTVLCGLPRAAWPLFILPEDKTLRMFESLIEALHHLGQSDLGGGTHSEGGQKGMSEQEIKSKMLDELLKKYEVYWATNDYDPLRLEFIAGQYAAKPTTGALEVEKRGLEQALQLKKDVELLEKSNEELARTLEQHMLLRKMPFSETEWALKNKTLNAELKTLQKTLSELQKVSTALEEGMKAVEANRKTTETRAIEMEKALQQAFEAQKKLNAEQMQKWKDEDAKAELEFQKTKTKLEGQFS